jgi:hypothetical protein
MSSSTLVGAPARSVARPLIPRPLHALLPLALAALWAIAVSRAKLDEMTDLGLVSVLPTSAIALLCVLTVSFCLTLTRRPLRPLLPLIHVLVLVGLLYGITTYLEAVPRTETVYKHVGVMQYIAANGSVDPTIDAYFNWPGFFALGAVISNVAGFDTPLAFAGWGPLSFNLLLLAPLLAILRCASDDPRVTWLGTWVFFCANWVGQDIIAPQAVAYFLWLVMLAILLRYFTGRRTVRAEDLRGLLHEMRHRRSSIAIHPGHQRAGLVLVVIAIFGAIVTGHQLTPFAGILVTGALVFVARLEPRTLPVIMAVLTAAWISYVATAYLAGNITTLVRPLGAVGQNVSQNVGGRYEGSPDHLLILQLRIAVSAAIGALAVAGFARRLAAGRGDVALAAAAGAPFLLAALQPYGGEIVLRVFLFALPAVAFFIACLAFPTPSAGRDWGTTLAIVAVTCALVVAFQFTRYGNERLDRFSTADAATVGELYRVAPRGSTLVAASTNLPWRYRDYASYRYEVLTSLPSWKASKPDPRKVIRNLEGKYGTGVYVIITRSTRVYASLLERKGSALDGLVRALRRSPRARELYHRGDGAIFRLEAG